jgi:hypothetical protein
MMAIGFNGTYMPEFKKFKKVKKIKKIKKINKTTNVSIFSNVAK